MATVFVSSVEQESKPTNKEIIKKRVLLIAMKIK